MPCIKEFYDNGSVYIIMYCACMCIVLMSQSLVSNFYKVHFNMTMYNNLIIHGIFTYGYKRQSILC